MGWLPVPIGCLNPTGLAGSSSPPARSQFDCLHVGYLPVFHCKSQQGPDDVPSIVAAGAWIHVKEAKRLVAHYFKNVGVTADKQTRPQPPDFLSGSTVVIARIAPDVRHVNCDALAIPNEILRNFSAEFRPVNVPVNSPNRPKGREPIQNLESPEVAGMPDLVALGEMAENCLVEKSVCI